MIHTTAHLILLPSYQFSQNIAVTVLNFGLLNNTLLKTIILYIFIVIDGYAIRPEDEPEKMRVRLFVKVSYWLTIFCIDSTVSDEF